MSDSTEQLSKATSRPLGLAIRIISNLRESDFTSMKSRRRLSGEWHFVFVHPKLYLFCVHVVGSLRVRI